MQSNSLYTETLTEIEQVGARNPSSGRSRGTRRFGMLDEVLMGLKTITPSDKVVLAAYDMKSMGCAEVWVSDAVMAKTTGLGRMTVYESRNRLDNRGLIEKMAVIEQVQGYRLVYRDILGRIRAGGSVPKISAKVECPQCRTHVNRVGKTGWCRKCSESYYLGERIHQAQKKLGAGATAEQIAIELKMSALTRRVKIKIAEGLANAAYARWGKEKATA